MLWKMSKWVFVKRLESIMYVWKVCEDKLPALWVLIVGLVLLPFSQLKKRRTIALQWPRKWPVPEKMKVGAYPDTVFHVSDSGRMTKELFFEWFKMFTQKIPPSWPVSLVLDGHGSHITSDVIEFVQSNNIHLLCLPSHTSHILQSLDVGVFKAFSPRPVTSSWPRILVVW